MSRPAVLVAVAALAVVLVGAIVVAQNSDSPSGVGGGTQVEAPGTRVDTDERGTSVDAPGTSVETNDSGTRVQAPGVDITIPNRDRE